MNIKSLYQLYLQHPVISTDTRNIPQNSIFFALKGSNFNGNTFASEALKKGAAYVVIDEAAYYIDKRTVLVDDVLTALQELAKQHRSQLTIPVIGITGTNGKTTTKELLYAVLSQQFSTFATAGNLNNHIGVPLSVLSITPAHQMAIIEMGANHQGEIAELCTISQPNYGLITNVGKAHLEGFGGFEGVKKAKGELYSYLKEHQAIVFYDSDNAHLEKMLPDNVNKIAYSVSKQATTISAFPTVEVDIAIGTNKIACKTQLSGTYNLPNILAAACVGNYFGVSAHQIQVGLEDYSPANNRSQLELTDKNTLIMDAYNANPSSMQAALAHFEHFKAGKKGAILGDMFELGDESAEEHKALLDQAAQLNLDVCLVAGKWFCQENTYSQIKAFATTEELLDYLSEQKLAGYTLLIKGSRGMKLEQAKAFL